MSKEQVFQWKHLLLLMTAEDSTKAFKPKLAQIIVYRLRETRSILFNDNYILNIYKVASLGLKTASNFLIPWILNWFSLIKFYCFCF